MGFRDAWRAFVGRESAGQWQNVTFEGPTVRDLLAGQTVEDLWRTQPHLRTVVTFVARNIAQLGLHTFERVSDTDRRRLRDDPIARVLAQPNATTTTYELVYGLVGDLALYDKAYWLVAEADSPSGWQIRAIPPSWATQSGGGSIWEPDWVEFINPVNGARSRVPTENLLIFHGWNPGRPGQGSSPVDALRQIIAEQVHAYAYRQQVWQNGGRVGAVLSRPADAPGWSDEARKRFSDDWKAKWTGDSGPKAGGTPLLEDGMTLQRIGFSAHEDEWTEAAKLALATVASVYHVNPTMVGILDNANYSNVREFRRMLYGDSLGPVVAMIESRLNAFLVPRISESSNAYVEFNVGEKLKGSFEEQAGVMSTLVGRPIMTGDEGRAKFNLPALGGDMATTVTPLNVLVGGQASPRDSGSQNEAGGPKARGVWLKARAPKTYEEKHREVLQAFFKRQSSVVRNVLGAKADDDWWDGDRWDKELSGDLFGLAVETTSAVAAGVVSSLGFDEDDYDVDRTRAYLTAMTDRVAQALNSATKGQLDAAIASEDPRDAVGNVFEIAQTSRTDQAATTAVTALSGFAATEATKQVAGDRGTKTWIVTSTNPRDSHAEVDGETVQLSDYFSNGLLWPGDGGDADEVSGCTCELQMNVA